MQVTFSISPGDQFSGPFVGTLYFVVCRGKIQIEKKQLRAPAFSQVAIVLDQLPKFSMASGFRPYQDMVMTCMDVTLIYGAWTRLDGSPIRGPFFKGSHCHSALQG